MWYDYVAALFSGAFLANFVPHFVHGVSGNKFPTPFSSPRGIGLSSPTINVLWALFNLLAAYLLYIVVPIDRAHPLLLVTYFIGICILSIGSSIGFQRKHKE
jgi:hypothetical protein